jgi:hypothetical protein
MERAAKLPALFIFDKRTSAPNSLWRYEAELEVLWALTPAAPQS